MSDKITTEELARITQKGFTAVHGEIADLRTEMNKKFEAVDQKLEAVDQKLEAVDQQFNRVFTGIGEIKDLLVTEVGQVKERVTRIEETIGIGQ